MTPSSALLWILPPLLLLMAILAAGHALLNKRDSRAAFGWIALCIILPLAGPVIYLIFGVNRVNNRARKGYITKLLKDYTDTISDPVGTNFRPVSTVGERVVGKGLSSCDEVTILENGEGLYPAMLEAINAAATRVLLCSYIFDSDSTGLQFVEALSAARKRGAEVKVVLDGMGELMSFPRIGKALQRAGIEFTRFNPVTLIPPSLNINMRSHRKMLIIDSLYAFTGGANIGSRHLCALEGNRHPVQDIHFRLKGRIVDELEWAFRRDWHYSIGTRKLGPFRHSNPNRSEAPVWSRLVLDGPNKELDRLNDLILGVISAASSRVWIMTPYFLPSQDLIGALIAAHLRGVDVQILLPGENNIKPAHWAARNVLRTILEHDIAVYYQPPPFIHSKLLLIDGQYSLIGSANLDPRSLRLNYELGVELFSPDVNQQLSQYVLAKRGISRRVTKTEIESRSLPERIRDSIAWLFSPYL
ncbi:MAG: phospholipase D-like domain-containing protein [Gammaproteobacteria bacterium]|nr:phospholipase D-like domain-containing protein [Gammaproteobacteria bacterium]MDP2141711.1 phospholipase D-like domain-containing protein [Gammaproteobacteria bacterium]MDP2347946.1 phospholipase D-like domain-containing protein [Gammaproteobacteria bacterium]